MGFLVDGNGIVGCNGNGIIAGIVDGSKVMFGDGKEDLEVGEGDSAFKIALKSILAGSWVDITKICSKCESSTEI